MIADASKAVDAGPALRVKQCFQMPVYPATLQHIPAPMKESVILTFGRQLKTSLQHVHQKGYGHNDVKAANIFNLQQVSDSRSQSSRIMKHALGIMPRTAQCRMHLSCASLQRS